MERRTLRWGPPSAATRRPWGTVRLPLPPGVMGTARLPLPPGIMGTVRLPLPPGISGPAGTILHTIVLLTIMLCATLASAEPVEPGVVVNRPVAASSAIDAVRMARAHAGSTVRPAEPGVSPLAAFDATLQAMAAEESDRRDEAILLWKSAADADPRALAPRLALGRLLAFSHPAGATNALREAAELVGSTYPAQRWAIRQAVLGLALGIVLASFLLLAGLVGRHLRALQHLAGETLSRALPMRSATGPLSWAFFTLPFLAGLGAAAGMTFLAFASSFRFNRRERMATLAAAAACAMIGPALLIARPLWSLDPAGIDGLLIAEAQRDPASPPAQAAALAWAVHEPGSAIPSFLRGLDHLRSGRPDSAATRFDRATAAGGLPPAVLETNLGSARFLEGNVGGARPHYERAAAIDPGRFEPHYDLSIVLATLGDYPGADAAMEEAGRAGLDRLRDIGRTEHGDGPRVPVEAPLSTVDLWNIDLRRPVPAAPPALLGALLPLQSPWATAPAVLLAALTGFFAGRRLRRPLAVHVCFQCGAPICRRCLVRIDRHAYCRACSESMGCGDLAETTRLLLRRLLEERPTWPGRLRPALLGILPGIGATLAGNAGAGLAAALPAGLGITLLAFPFWGDGCLPLPVDLLVAPLLAPAGLLLLAVALVLNALGVRAAERGNAGLRAFFERDVDRSAA
jgi:tetratricopeptide (TPR) repeat protein